MKSAKRIPAIPETKVIKMRLVTETVKKTSPHNVGGLKDQNKDENLETDVNKNY